MRFVVQEQDCGYYVKEYGDNPLVNRYMRKDGTVGSFTELSQEPDLYCWGTRERAEKFATLLQQKETLAQEIVDRRLELHDTEIDLDQVEKELKAMTEKPTFKKGDKFVSGLGNKYIVIEKDKAVCYESNVPHMVGKIYPNLARWSGSDWYTKIIS